MDTLAILRVETEFWRPGLHLPPHTTVVKSNTVDLEVRSYGEVDEVIWTVKRPPP